MAMAAIPLATIRSNSSDTWLGWASDVTKALRWTSASVTRNEDDARTSRPD